jgi:hypothetical protein
VGFVLSREFDETGKSLEGIDIFLLQFFVVVCFAFFEDADLVLYLLLGSIDEPLQTADNSFHLSTL